MKIKKIIIRVLFLSFLTFNIVNAATYYVDASQGNDSNSGTSTSSAWKTISKVNSTSFKPGDIILLKRGGVWREQISIASSGSSGSPVTIGDYGTGNKPVISGADLVSGFQSNSSTVWKKTGLSSAPQQVFFNGIRGIQKSSLADVSSDRSWYYDSGSSTLYIYSKSDPAGAYTNPGIEKTSRNFGIYVNSASYQSFKNLQVEKTSDSGVKLTASAQKITIDSLSLLQWSVQEAQIGGIGIFGNGCEIKNCRLGKNTGNDTDDQSWAGFMGIYINGPNNSVHDNFIWHSCVEYESTNQSYAMGIKIYNASGTTNVFNNQIYHVAGHGIMVLGYFNSGDIINIYNNVIDHPGQAGISAYKTRANDGVGGQGFIYGNTVSFANRLSGTPNAGAGNSSCGIHLNDGVQANAESGKPFIKWSVYENTVHDCQAPASPKDEDSGGIAIDFNANGVKVYRNLIYNNWGKGLYIWNADGAQVSYNIIYGNDAGIIVSSQGGDESANDNQIFNNTLYKNYNGDHGPGLNCEIYFGRNNKNTTIKNNIIYASGKGYAFDYAPVNQSGCISDYNVFYQDSSTSLIDDETNGKLTFSQWTSKHSGWDGNSMNKNPLFSNPANGDFSLQSSSPAIDKGTNVGLQNDFSGKSIIRVPDIGAMEFTSKTSPVEPAAPNTKMDFNLLQNFPNPFNPSTSIEYFINENTLVSLKVYDLQGKEITTLVDEVQPAGTHNVNFNASNLASGLYFYQLKINGAIQTKKMQLIK